MPSLWLPNGPAEAILAEKAGQDEAKRVMGVRTALRGIDDRLDLFLCKQDDPDNDLRAGFWYVWRRNDNGTIAMWQVQTHEGGYREPDDGIVEAFRKMDRDTIDTFRDEQARKHRERKRRVERKREAASWRLKEECDFLFRTQVPVKDGIPQRARKKAA